METERRFLVVGGVHPTCALLWFAGLAGEPLAPWDPLCGEKEIPARTLHCRMEELNKSNLN